jgi:hypothetical protein
MNELTNVLFADTRLLDHKWGKVPKHTRYTCILSQMSRYLCHHFCECRYIPHKKHENFEGMSHTLLSLDLWALSLSEQKN